MFFLKNIDKSWNEFFQNELIKEEIENIYNIIIKNGNFVPNSEDVFKVFNIPFEKIKVIILGQDPYYKKGVADGIAFSTKKNNFIPLTLQNIFKELKSDIDCSHSFSNGDLSEWLNQGVFLVNTALTVELEKPLSHSNIWKNFIINLIFYIKKRNKELIWVFWGRKAKDLSSICKINPENSIWGIHPSPLSADYGFFGSKPFSLINKKLFLMKKKIILWCSFCK